MDTLSYYHLVDKVANSNCSVFKDRASELLKDKNTSLLDLKCFIKEVNNRFTTALGENTRALLRKHFEQEGPTKWDLLHIKDGQVCNVICEDVIRNDIEFKLVTIQVEGKLIPKRSVERPEQGWL